LGLAGFHQIHAEDELVAVDRCALCLLVVLAGTGQIRNPIEFQEFFRRCVDSIGGDDVAWEWSGSDIRIRSRTRARIVDLGDPVEIAALHGGSGDAVQRLRGTALAKGFIVAHEEQAVLAVEEFRDDHRPAQGAAILIPFEGILRRTRGAKRVIFGVQLLVAEKLECGAVKLVSAGTRQHIDLRRGAAKFGGIDTGLNLEFL
jgi:hypothetical protein